MDMKALKPQGQHSQFKENHASGIPLLSKVCELHFKNRI